jgi:hypothetical protein
VGYAGAVALGDYGSVIGEQQTFLCEREQVMRSAGAAFAARGPTAVATMAGGLAAAERLIAETVRRVDNRIASAMLAAPEQQPAGKSVELCGGDGGSSDGCCGGGGGGGGRAEELAAHVSAASDRRNGERAARAVAAAAVRAASLEWPSSECGEGGGGGSGTSHGEDDSEEQAATPASPPPC